MMVMVDALECAEESEELSNARLHPTLLGRNPPHVPDVYFPLASHRGFDIIRYLPSTWKTDLEHLEVHSRPRKKLSRKGPIR